MKRILIYDTTLRDGSQGETFRFLPTTSFISSRNSMNWAWTMLKADGRIGIKDIAFFRRLGNFH